ncbi:Gfo/Idh/MocA family oxidoreductase [bacterium]|nr:Gfo/Idh/MocA family oxidoreductase [bacterium]
MRQLKSAVVGVGYLGRFHAEKHASSTKSKLVAVVDRNPEHASAMAEHFQCQSFTDYQALVGKGIDCVSVAASTPAHYEITKYLLENGIDVLVEKPMTTSAQEALELIAIAKKHQRILQVGHLERFNPAYKALEGKLTAPRFFEAKRVSAFSGRSSDVDVVFDLMIHDLDIITHLANSEVVRIDAVGVPVLTASIDIANVRLTFQNGAVANITASRVANATERSIRVFQPEVYLAVDFGRKRLRLTTKVETPEGPKLGVEEISIGERDALNDEIDSFFNAVLTRSTPEVTGEDGYRAVMLADQIRQAIYANYEQVELASPTQAHGAESAVQSA